MDVVDVMPVGYATDMEVPPAAEKVAVLAAGVPKAIS
jgi:hypothetical protein